MPQKLSVVDLFSGAGGMSCGFQRHSDFAVAGAVDAQLGLPSSSPGSLGCNASYAASIGVQPVSADLASSDPAEVCQALGLAGQPPTVLAACPPCTGFSRTMAGNHLRDDQRNGLVEKVGEYAALLRPDIVLVENAHDVGRRAFHGEQLRKGKGLYSTRLTAKRNAPNGRPARG